MSLVTRGQAEDDRSWGRIGGARPPLAAAAPLLFWLAGAIVLALVVLGVIRAPGPLDDPSRGDQRDGGPPVGYAVIDRNAGVRYATLDPAYPEHGFEVEIVAGALR